MHGVGHFERGDIPGDARWTVSQEAPASALNAPSWSVGNPTRASAARSESAAKRKNAPITSVSAQAIVRTRHYVFLVSEAAIVFII